MKSMIWKELRENALYGLLLLIASAATIVVLMNSEFTNRLNLHLFADELPFTFSVMGSITAVVLACLQTVPELWRDRWAFLIHRGMSGGAIFRAKTTAALVIYAIVIGLPLLIATLWAMWVGYRHYPFEWRMVLPSILSGVASFGFYFVVYHIVLRERGFPLWRVLPIALPLAAVGANLALFSNNHFAFWSSAVIVLPLTALGGMVAYRTMVSHGAMQDFGATPGRFLVGTNFVTLTMLLGCGLGCAWFVADWVVFDALGVVRSERSERSRTNITPWVDIDGEVMESAITWSSQADATHGYMYKLIAIRNLSHPESSKYSEFVGQENFWSDWEDKLPLMSSASAQLRYGAYIYPPADMTPFFQELRQLGPILTPPPKYLGPAGEDQISPLRHLTWQLSATNGVILGYAQERLERTGNRVVRSPQELKYVIGPDGIFEYPKWPNQRFGKCLASATDFDGHSSEDDFDLHSAPEFRPAYLFENGLFEIDLAAKTVSALFTPPAGKAIRNLDMFGDRKDQLAVFVDGEVLVCKAVPHSIGRRWSGGSVAVGSESQVAGDASTDDDVAVQPMPFGVPRADDNTTYEWKLDDIELLIPGEVVATIPVPDEIDSFAYGRVGYDADRNTAWFDRRADPWTGPRRIVELDLSSQKTRTFREGLNLDLGVDLGSWEVGKVASFAAIAPLGPVAAFLGFEETRYFATGVSFFAVLTHARPAWLLIAAAVLILSAVLWSYVGKRYAIRFGIDADKHRRWQLIGLLFGPAGILAMVTAHYCPNRVRCSHCHRRRVVTRELCEHCDAKFAEPKMNGTEILVGAST